MANEPGAPAPTENTAPATTPASAPAPQQSSSPAPTTASESLFKKLETHVPDKKMSWDDIQATMNGAPPPATVPTTDATGAQTAEGDKVGAGLPPTAQPASTATPPVVQAAPPSAEAQLRADIAARDEYIRQLMTGGTKPAAPPADPNAKAAPPVDEIPAHMYQFPAELVAGFKSEDPVENGKAMSNYTALVARTIHKQLREEYTKKISDVVNGIPQMVQKVIQHQTETKAIFEDFYGANKDLNKPALYPVVLNTAMALMKETNATSWTPEFAKALADRVRATLGVTAPAAAPAQPPVRQPAMMGTGARPAADPVTQSDKQVNEIMSTLRGF